MSTDRTIRIFYVYRFLSSFFLIGPIITLFFLEFIPFSQLGIVFAVGIATAFAFEIPSGVWADRFGRTYVVALGSFLAGIELVLIAYGQSFGYFLAAAIVGGIGSALVSGADTAIVYDSLLSSKRQGESGKVYGRARAIRYFAIVIAALIGAPLYTYAQTMPLYVNGGVMFAAGLLVLTIREPPRSVRSYGWYVQVEGIREGFTQVLRSTTLRWFIAFSVFSGIAVWLYHDLLKLPHLELIGYPIASLGIIVAVISTIRSVVSWNADRIARSFGEGRTYVMLLLAPGMLLIAIGLIPSMVALLLIIVLYCIWSVQEVFCEAKIHELISSDKRATIYSIHSFLNSVMLFIGALILSVIAELASLFTALIVAGCASMLFAALLLRSRPKQTKHTKRVA